MTSFSENQPISRFFIGSDGPIGLADEISEYLADTDIVVSHEVYYFGSAFLIEVEPLIDAEEAAVLLKLKFSEIEIEMKRTA